MDVTPDTPMPDPQRELAKLDAGATPGDWVISHCVTHNAIEIRHRLEGSTVRTVAASVQFEADAELIVWLRNHATALIASQAAEIGAIRELHKARPEEMVDEDSGRSIEVMVCEHCFHLVYPDGSSDGEYYDPDVFYPCPTVKALARLATLTPKEGK